MVLVWMFKCVCLQLKLLNDSRWEISIGEDKQCNSYVSEFNEWKLIGIIDVKNLLILCVWLYGNYQ